MSVDVDAAELAVKDLLAAFGIGGDDHTDRTPARAAAAWGDILAGYAEDPADQLDTTFSAPDNPGLVIVAGVALRSICAHHLLPFTGTATVAYRPSPGQRIVGLSKLARVITGYASRLQVQERIGQQTVAAIMARLRPSGAAVIITATHDCMRLRGVCEDTAATTTYLCEGLLLPHEQDLIREAHSAHGLHRR